ncbi:MAG: hypothetical protein A2Y25_00080 [Candidatus Melainabacteria bacterium GWF2_37_15]|nr:MAG: hypothetical protein A2Y25_00080 [Candidatus Melainabacteria bacterium GWF2_37_15]
MPSINQVTSGINRFAQKHSKAARTQIDLTRSKALTHMEDYRDEFWMSCLPTTKDKLLKAKAYFVNPVKFVFVDCIFGSARFGLNKIQEVAMKGLQKITKK